MGEHRQSPRAAWPAPAAVVTVFYAAALPLIALQFEAGRGRFDQVNHHQPTILRLAEQLPTPGLSDYLTATTPGYHLVLAVFARFVTDLTAALQALGSLFTAALLLLISVWASRRAGTYVGIALGLTVAASLYVFSAGVFLLPDNAAWLFVLGVLLLALRGKTDPAFYMGGGLLMATLVCTRQSHLWAAAMLWTAAYLGPARTNTRLDAANLLRTLPSRLPRTALALIATLPAFGVVAAFAALWDGLLPPAMGSALSGFNGAVAPVILLQLAIFGFFHAAFWLPALLRAARARAWLIPLLAAIGLIIASAPVTTYDYAAGRGSGVWNVVRVIPDIAGHTNPLFVVGVPFGVLAVAGWLAALRAREAWILLATLVAFTAAMSFTGNAWTRYHEPLLLIWCVLASALAVENAAADAPRFDRVIRRARLAGPAGLALLLASVTTLKLATSDPVRVSEQPPNLTRDATELWPRSWREEGPPPHLRAPEIE